MHVVIVSLILRSISIPNESDTNTYKIGGSLAGLMQGIAIKRLGHDVTILEQTLSDTREGQAAGIVTMEHSHQFLIKHDLFKHEPYAVNCSAVQILGKDLIVKPEFQRPMRTSSWNVLYYRFRANFDGFKSTYIHHAVQSEEQGGLSRYEHGKKVTGLQLVGNKMDVIYEDLVKKSTESLTADLV